MSGSATMTAPTQTKAKNKMSETKWPDGSDDLPPMEPYDVTCARCGKVLSCNDAVAEEGDEWECFPCNDRENARERAELRNRP
jgi:hypothetical protein